VDILRQLPKTDLHCRLDGSISLHLLWSELGKIGGHNVQSFAELEKIVQPPKHTKESSKLAKELMASVLQTKEQLEKACDDIYATAAEDGILYMELMVRPILHVKKGLSYEDVVKIVLDCKPKLESKYSVYSGVVLYVMSDEDDRGNFCAENAALAVKYRKDGVCGFGVFGPDVQDIKVDSYFEFCPDVLKFLKDEHMNICIAAGKSDPRTIVTALHDGGATRISGAFSIHHKPSVMAYFALHSIPIELGVTDAIENATSDIRTFANPIQLLLDSELRVTICSFDNALYPQTRPEIILKLVEECDLGANELMKLLSVGFRRNFHSFHFRSKLFDKFWQKASQILSQNNFTAFNHEIRYFTQQKLQ